MRKISRLQLPRARCFLLIFAASINAFPLSWRENWSNSWCCKGYSDTYRAEKIKQVWSGVSAAFYTLKTVNSLLSFLSNRGVFLSGFWKVSAKFNTLTDELFVSFNILLRFLTLFFFLLLFFYFVKSASVELLCTRAKSIHFFRSLLILTKGGGKEFSLISEVHLAATIEASRLCIISSSRIFFSVPKIVQYRQLKLLRCSEMVYDYHRNLIFLLNFKRNKNFKILPNLKICYI